MDLAHLLGDLARFDTPTVCNALELVEPERRRFGYTTRQLHAINAGASPCAGIAHTATMRSLDRPALAGEDLKLARLEYYRYVAGDDDLPKICVMQDLDGKDAGRGPFWGEFNTRIHQALGVRGIVTDGSIRDIANLPDSILILSAGPRPSHGFVHVVDFGSQVNVHGMVVRSGDIVHADGHGAVAFPPELAVQVIEGAEAFMEEERPVLEACKQGRLTFGELEALYMMRPAIGETRQSSR